MARQKELNLNTPLKEVTLVALLLFIPRVLIAIGDAVRFIASLVFHVLATTISTTGIVIRERLRALPRPKKKKIVKIPAIKLPKITIPKFHVPKIVLPKIRFPQLPKFKKRLRRLPPPPAVVRIWPTKTEQIKSFIAGVCVTVLFFFLPYNAYQWLKALPNPQLLTERDVEVTTKIFDRNGVLLYEIYTDQNRTPLPLSQIPKLMQEATISIEDKNFYQHPGFSLTGIIRAARETILDKQIQGGSTITQQLIKSALLTPEISIPRKVKEIILAFSRLR